MKNIIPNEVFNFTCYWQPFRRMLLSTMNLSLPWENWFKKIVRKIWSETKSESNRKCHLFCIYLPWSCTSNTFLLPSLQKKQCSFAFSTCCFLSACFLPYFLYKSFTRKHKKNWDYFTERLLNVHLSNVSQLSGFPFVLVCCLKFVCPIGMSTGAQSSIFFV